MNRSQMQDMLGGPVVFGRERKAPGIAWLWRSAEPHHWCATCRRTFPNGVHRLVNGTQTCPYSDCSGEVSLQAYDWSEIRRRRPNYPITPSMQVQYGCDRPGSVF